MADHDTVALDQAFEAEAGKAFPLSPLITRVTAPNPGPFTFKGTNTYLVGREILAVIDPGPDDEDHLRALLQAIAGRPVSHIAVTHTHRDHSPLAARLAQETGATVAGCAPHHSARPLHPGEVNPFGASNDMDYQPNRTLKEGEDISGDGWTLETVETPGHTANHLVFRLAEENALFSGDHVMGWNTTVIGPPDGNMRAYLASLDKLLHRDEACYWPGHGGPVLKPRPYVAAIIKHRRQREAMILADLETHGPQRIKDMVPRVYPGLDEKLLGAAALSTFAHLEALIADGRATADGPATRDTVYRLAVS